MKLCGIDEDSDEEYDYITTNWSSMMGDEEGCVGLRNDLVGKQKQRKQKTQSDGGNNKTSDQTGIFKSIARAGTSGKTMADFILLLIKIIK